jgi:ComF family protein
MIDCLDWLRSLRDVIFPPRCGACGCFLACTQKAAIPFPGATGRSPVLPPADDDPETRRFDSRLVSFLCPSCRRGCFPLGAALCRQCGAGFESGQTDDRLCGDCLSAPKHFARARAAGVYDQTLRILIHNLKYRGRLQLAEPLGALLHDACKRWWRPGTIDLLVPVPLHAKRLRERGFNQSNVLIRGWQRFERRCDGAWTRVPVLGRTLVRCRSTQPQTGLGRGAREDNIHGAFKLTRPREVELKRVLLLDDVYTTGSTVNECARTLLRGGAASVGVLTLARAP